MRRAQISLACSLIVFLFTGFYVTQNRSEYQVKAVFLYNFSQFVDWPQAAFASNESFVIGVLGSDPMGSYLDQAVKGESVKGKPIIVRRYSSVEEAYGSNILFIREGTKEEMKKILNKLKGKNILTVSDNKGFAQQGGVIEFITKDNKIALRINLGAAKSEQLQISSKLLRLAEVIGD